MIVSIITVKLYASWIHSLKEKRKIVKSLIEKLRNKYNVSVVKVMPGYPSDHHTLYCFSCWQLNFGRQYKPKICNFESNTDAEVVDILIESG